MPNDHGVRASGALVHVGSYWFPQPTEQLAANAADAIRKAIEGVRAKALDDLLKYGCHTAACDHLMSDPNGCSCGWKDLRAQLKDKPNAT